MADKTYELTFELSDGSKKKVTFTAPQGEKGDTGAAGAKGETGAAGAAGADGADGGYYIPSVTQIDEYTAKMSFTPSQDGMREATEQRIDLPPGVAGDPGGYYIPSVDEDGNLTWEPSDPFTMAGYEGSVNIKGPKGKAGYLYIVGDSTEAGTWTGSHEDITEYYDGLTIAYKTNIAGLSGGTTLNINGLGAIAVKRNGTSSVTTNYAVGSVLILTYSTTDGVGYWQIADYDSNTKNTAGTSNKVGTKLFLAGAASQASSATTYSNKNCYIGTDNCLYSNGAKVTTEADVTTLINDALGVIENGSY